MRRLMAKGLQGMLAEVSDPSLLRGVGIRLDIHWLDERPEGKYARRDGAAPRISAEASCGAVIAKVETVSWSADKFFVNHHVRTELPESIGAALADALDSNGTDWRRGLTRLSIVFGEDLAKGASAHEIVEFLQRIGDGHASS